jgi:hypothetical protein
MVEFTAWLTSPRARSSSTRPRELAGASLYFLEQPHVLNRDYGLVCEYAEKGELLVRDRPNLHAPEQDRPYRVSFPQQRSSKGSSMAVSLGVSRSFRKIALRRLQVRDVDDGPIIHSSSCDPKAVYRLHASQRPYV